jgi:O-antigen/teichoic acid export membrane protein
MPGNDSSQPNSGSSTAISRLMAAPKRLIGRRFAREVFTLQMGSFVTMGLQFAVAVTIANLLGAALYGVYFQARALLDLVNMLANLAVGQALITRIASAHSRGDEGETRDLMAYFLKVGLTVGFLEMAVGLLAGPLLGRAILDDPEIGYLARILFVSPPLLVAFNMVILALQSTRQVLRLTLLENGALIGISLLNVTVVALGWGVHGLLYSVALAPALTSVAALLVYRSAQSRMAGMPTLGQIVRAAPGIPYRRYFAFSALVSIDKNFASLLNLLPTLLLGRLASSAEVAYFRVGYNLMSFLSVPLAPIARNLYATLSDIYSRHGPRRLGSSLLKVSLAGGGISMTATIVMMLASPFILMIYRPEYGAVQAVIYALGVRFALIGFGVGLGPIYQVLDAMKLAIATKIVPGIIMFGGGWMLVSEHGAVGAALTIVLAYLVGDLTNVALVPWMLRRAARGRDEVSGIRGDAETRGVPSPAGEG